MHNIVSTSVWFCMLTTFYLCSSVQSGYQKDLTKAKSGLEIGKGIADMIKEANFEQSLKEIGKKLSHFLGAIGPFIGFLSVLLSSESRELSYLKEMMKHIDKQFEQMDKRFDTIEKMIKWNVVQVNFGQIEQRIQAMAREYRYLYMVPPIAVENRKKIYIKNYESDYQNSGTKLYQSIVNKQGTFQEDLGTSVMRYTDHDRRKTQLFLLGVMQLILQAIKIELAYLFSYKYDHNANFMKSQWINRTEEVRTKFNDIDDQCIRAYFGESKRDIDEFSAKNYGKPNKQFATELYNLLAERYYWRDWIVVTYNTIPDDVHYKNYKYYQMMRVTGGQTLLRKHGRNLLVTSVDKNHPTMNLSRAKQKLNAKVSNGIWASDIFFYVDHSGASKGASLVSVITMYIPGVAFKCNTKRLVNYVRYPLLWIIMWG